MNIIYFGFNSFRVHKRGVENVIDFQSQAGEFKKIVYIHWANETKAYKNQNKLCIAIENCWYWPFILNAVLFRLKKKHEFKIHSHSPLFSIFSIYNSDIFTVHDALYYSQKNIKSKFLFIFKFLENVLYTRCKMVHFISKYAKKESLFNKNKNYCIIYNTSHFEKKATKKIISLENIISNNILIVRSIEERARIDLVIDVAQKMTEYNFTIAGKGPLLEYYQSVVKIRNIKNVQLLGYVSDNNLLDLYQNCLFVLLTAEYAEGFGLPIIEGYLFNKPVLASNKCAIPEIIIANRYLFENNVKSIIHAIKSIEPCNENKFSNYYFNKFSNLAVSKEYFNLYKNIF